MKTRKTILIIMASVASIFLTIGMLHTARAEGSVIFRLDDVQDYWSNNGTKAIMDLFMQKKVPLTTAIITAQIGKDKSVVDKTSQGIKAGLFEAALHGFEHVDYATLSPNAQSVTITKGNMIIKQLFGVHPFVFVPPYDSYNNETIATMQTHDMNIISTDTNSEARFHGKGVIFNASEPCGTTDSPQICPPKPYHVSVSDEFRVLMRNHIRENSNAEILNQTADNVQRYGYSVLIIHPQDMVYTNATTGKIIKNVVNPQELARLGTLIDRLATQYGTTSMGALVSSVVRSG